MTPILRAYGVHLFTATGAVLAMLAMLAAVEERWSLMFLWLVLAFVVDGLDGPMARRFHVRTYAPNLDGVLLDLIIDYLTYVFIPAFALFSSGLIPDLGGWVALVAMTLGSVLYFADTRMKTADRSFAGFPACWNMVALVLFATQPDGWLALAVVLVLTVAMFLPLRFVHPVRTRRWRSVSLPVALLWTALAAWAALADFDQPPVATWGLVLASIYLALVGLAQQVWPLRDRG